MSPLCTAMRALSPLGGRAGVFSLSRWGRTGSTAAIERKFVLRYRCGSTSRERLHRGNRCDRSGRGRERCPWERTIHKETTSFDSVSGGDLSTLVPPLRGGDRQEDAPQSGKNTGKDGMSADLTSVELKPKRRAHWRRTLNAQIFLPT